MTSTMTPDEIKAHVPTGLLSFPLTDFDPSGAFDAAGYRRRLVFNFTPRTALAFHAAVVQRDNAVVGGLLRNFFFPYLRIRNRQPGYAVSIVKAGAAIVGRGAGPVRPPLTDLDQDELASLAALIAALGPQ